MVVVAKAPKREKVCKGHYMSADEDGVPFDIKQHPIYKDWDVRGPKGLLYFREGTLADALWSIETMHEGEFA